MSNRVATYFALLIGLVWTVAFIVGAISRDYTAFSVATPVLLVACGFLFGYKPGRNGGSA